MPNDKRIVIRHQTDAIAYALGSYKKLPKYGLMAFERIHLTLQHRDKWTKMLIDKTPLTIEAYSRKTGKLLNTINDARLYSMAIPLSPFGSTIYEFIGEPVKTRKGK